MVIVLFIRLTMGLDPSTRQGDPFKQETPGRERVAKRYIIQSFYFFYVCSVSAFTN